MTTITIELSMNTTTGKPRIAFLNVGQPDRILLEGNKTLNTALLKQTVNNKINLSKLGLEGDQSADTRIHGGEDKALCAYPHQHYPFWEEQLNRKLSRPAFGENLTIEGLDENNLCIGDIYKFGETRIQCSQPRQPCIKLIKYYGVKEMAHMMENSGFTGFYFRVLKTGQVDSQSELVLDKKHPDQISVNQANQLMYGKEKKNKGLIEHLLSVDALSLDWRKFFEKRLKAL